MANKSMTDAAYEIMCTKKRAIQFSRLWAEVSKVSGVPKEKVADFYSDLILDGRFAALKDNKWDLKTRRKFSESHVDLKKIEVEESDNEYIDEEQISESEEDKY